MESERKELHYTVIKEDVPFCFFKTPTYGYIMDVYCIPEKRRNGYASKIMEKLISWLRDNGGRDFDEERLRYMKTVYSFEFGLVEIEYEDDVLYRLRCNPIVGEMSSDLTDGHSEFSDNVFRQLQEFLNGQRRNFDVKYQMKGTEFQKKVWTALLDVPYGETRTYKQVAEAIGNPNASRAVGMANNRNPLMFIVSCHRVIGSAGALVGYAGGLDLKKALLETEKRVKGED